MPVTTVDVDDLIAQAENSATASALSLDRLDLSNVRLPDGAPLDVAGAITAASCRRTIDGASTLEVTLFDPRPRTILNSGIFDLRREGRLDAIDVLLDTLAFRLVQTRKRGDSLTLTFEEQAVALLRAHDRPLSVSRNDMTRAQFVQRLVREVQEVRIPFYCPELREKQAIARPRDIKRRDAQRLPGFNEGAKLKIEGRNADPEQRRQLETSMQVADEEKAFGRARLAMIVAGIGESGFRVVKNPHSVYSGVFQADPANIPMRDTEGQARHFLRGGKGFQGGGAIALARAHADWTPGHIAYVVEGDRSNFGTDAEAEHFYQQHISDASAIVGAWGGDGTGGTTTRAAVEQARYTRGLPGKREKSWEAGQRLAGEVNWRLFVVAGVVFLISEEELFLSRARMVLDEATDGVDSIDFDWDEGKAVATATVQCHMNRWAAPPGTLVSLPDSGPASGYWLVNTIDRGDLFTSDTEVTLTKPLPRKREPAATVIQVPRAPDEASQGKIDGAFVAAKHIDSQNRPYGGGHGVRLDDIAPHAGLDCSAAVSLVLHRAGMFDEAMAWDTTRLIHWGEPGKGRKMTVWVNPLPGSAGHVWIEFDTPQGYRRFDTSPYGDGPSGPHVRSKRRPTTGFQPRHFKGA